MSTEKLPGRQSAASEHAPADFEKKTRAAAPDLKADFQRSHANDDRATEDSGSQQVQDTAMKPRPIPPPSLDHAGARRAHSDALYRDDQAARAKNAKVKEEHPRASKEAFLQRRTAERAKERPTDREIERE